MEHLIKKFFDSKMVILLGHSDRALNLKQFPMLWELDAST